MGIKVVSHESIPEFERKVNELLEQGYTIISCGKNEESCWAILSVPKPK
jgi:hypothetical protein